MVNIAILGYGVVGSGVVEILQKNNNGISNRAGKNISVKKILDIRDFNGDPNQDLFTKNPDEVFLDDSIDIVVETIGGTGVAYELTKKAFKSGKSVVSSNKELVATHGSELLGLSSQNGVSYLFEASVGGGIPIIRPLYNCLAANEIGGITGILNGTTNYILTSMKRDGKSFEVALKEAQENGYAEADPTADIGGHDACRKIAILSSIAYDQFVDYKEIPTEGIERLTLDDIEYAELSGGTIKLVAQSKRLKDGIYARVSPALIYKSHPLANVEDVFNAIIVEGDAVGDAMFYGRGAGKLPTASAVVADVIDIAKKGKCTGLSWSMEQKMPMVDFNQAKAQYLIRLTDISDKQGLINLIQDTFGNVQYIERLNNTEAELAFITKDEKEINHMEAVNTLNKAGCTIAGRIRIIK